MKRISLILSVFAFLGASLLYGGTINIKNGWGMYGIDKGIPNINEFFKNYTNNIKIIWAFDSTKNKWKVFSPNDKWTTLISQNPNIGSLTSISQYEGFWIKSNNQFNINIPDSNTTNSSSTGFISNPTITTDMFKNVIISYSEATTNNQTKYFFFSNGKAYFQDAMGLKEANWTILNNKIKVSYNEGAGINSKFIEVEVLSKNNNSAIMSFSSNNSTMINREEVSIKHIDTITNSPVLTVSSLENKAVFYSTDMHDGEIYEFYTNEKGSIFNNMTKGFKDMNWTITKNNEINVSYGDGSIINSKLFKVEYLYNNNAFLKFINTTATSDNIKKAEIETITPLPTLTTKLFENKSIHYDNNSFEFYKNGKGFLNEGMTTKMMTWNIVNNKLSIVTDTETILIDFIKLYNKNAVLKIDSTVKIAKVNDLDSKAIIQPVLITAMLNNKKLVFNNGAEQKKYLFLKGGIVYFNDGAYLQKSTWTLNNNKIIISAPPSNTNDIIISIELLNNNNGKLKDKMNNIMDFKIEDVSYEDILGLL